MNNTPIGLKEIRDNSKGTTAGWIASGSLMPPGISSFTAQPLVHPEANGKLSAQLTMRFEDNSDRLSTFLEKAFPVDAGYIHEHQKTGNKGQYGWVEIRTPKVNLNVPSTSWTPKTGFKVISQDAVHLLINHAIVRASREDALNQLASTYDGPELAQIRNKIAPAGRAIEEISLFGAKTMMRSEEITIIQQPKQQNAGFEGTLPADYLAPGLRLLGTLKGGDQQASGGPRIRP